MELTDVRRRTRGRRSLNGVGDSPQLRVRMPDRLRAALAERAREERTTVSELARQLLSDAFGSELRPENQVQLELHRALLAKLVVGGVDGVRDLVQHNIASMRGQVRGSQAQTWLDEWADLIDGSPRRLVEVLLGEDEHSIDLRQVSPFAGVLTQHERTEAISRARRRA